MNELEWNAISPRRRKRAENGVFVARHQCKYKSVAFWGPKQSLACHHARLKELSFVAPPMAAYTRAG
jgi:hypothetical protein